MLNGGLKDLLNSFDQHGQGDVAGSWVGKGPNQQISPTDLNKVLGDDTLRTMIHDSASEQDMEKYARTFSRSIRDDGRAKVLAGETSLEELLRITRED